MRRNADAQQPVESVQFTGVKKLLKVEDVADILGVSKVKVYLLLRNGLPSVKIDGAPLPTGQSASLDRAA